MRLEISNAIRRDLHDEIRELTALGFRKTNDAAVEIHLRSRPPRPYFQVYARRDGVRISSTVRTQRELARRMERLRAQGCEGIEWARFAGYRDGMTGYAYYDVRGMRIAKTATFVRPKMASTSRWLVTLKIPSDPLKAAYPRVLVYPEMKTAPLCAVISWQEHYLHLVAHEARHTYQFAKRKRRSEIDAERWANKILNEIRLERHELAPLVWATPAEALELEELYRRFDGDVVPSSHAKLLDELRAGV